MPVPRATETPMTRMLKMMEEQVQMKTLERFINGNNNDSNGSNFDINEMYKMAMMGNIMSRSEKTNSDSVMPMMMWMMNNSNKGNGMDYNMMKAMLDNNKGDEKWLEMIKVMASDRNNNSQVNQFKEILQQQSNHQTEMRVMEEKLRETERISYVDKIDELVKAKGKDQGWSSQAMERIQKLVTDDMLAKVTKGIKSAEPDKSGVDSILESIGDVLKSAEPILKPMAQAAADSIKEKGVRQTFDPRTGQPQQATSTPQQQAVRTAMDQQTQEQQFATQQATAEQQATEEPQDWEQQQVQKQQALDQKASQQQTPYDEPATPTVPPLDFDEDYDLLRERKGQTQ